MWITDVIAKLFRLTYNVLSLFIITTNRWVAFAAHLIMMFFVWNILLIVIGVVSTTQLIIGFGCDVKDLTTPPTTIKESQEKEEEKEPTYWQQRRRAFQVTIDNLYVQYMDKLVNTQQEQAKYWQWENHYIYPQSRFYNIDENYYGEQEMMVEDNGSDVSSGMEIGSGVGGNNDHIFTPPIKITEDTSYDITYKI